MNQLPKHMFDDYPSCVWEFGPTSSLPNIVCAIIPHVCGSSGQQPKAQTFGADYPSCVWEFGLCASVDTPIWRLSLMCVGIRMAEIMDICNHGNHSMRVRVQDVIVAIIVLTNISLVK